MLASYRKKQKPKSEKPQKKKDKERRKSLKGCCRILFVIERRQKTEDPIAFSPNEAIEEQNRQDEIDEWQNIQSDYEENESYNTEKYNYYDSDSD